MTAGHHVVFRTSPHMPIDLVMTTVSPLSRIVTPGMRTIKKMRTQITKKKFVSISCSQLKLGAKKFLGNLGAVKALLGMARM